MIILNVVEVVINFLILGIGLCFWMIGIFMALMLIQVFKDGLMR